MSLDEGSGLKLYVHGGELLVAVDAFLIGVSCGRSDAKELQVV